MSVKRKGRPIKAQAEQAPDMMVLSTRVRTETRNAIAAAAKESGRTLSAEIEYRLRRSLLEHREIVEVLIQRKVSE